MPNYKLRYTQHGETREAVTCDAHLESMLEALEVSGARVFSTQPCAELCQHERCRKARE